MLLLLVYMLLERASVVSSYCSPTCAVELSPLVSHMAEQVAKHYTGFSPETLEGMGLIKLITGYNNMYIYREQMNY